MFKILKLKDICKVFDDGDWIEKKDQSEKGIRLIQTGNVKLGIFEDRIQKARYISNETFQRLKCTEIFEGDILVSRLPDPIGRSCIIPKLNERAITAVDCTIIRFKKGYLAEYVNYYMQSQLYFNEIQNKVSGATRQRISRKNLGEIKISIPPLVEQQRIVAKLDATFAEIDRLIIDNEKNLKNSQRIYQYTVDSFFEKNSKYKKMIGSFSKLNYGHTAKASYKKGSFKFLRITDIQEGEVNWESVPYCEVEKNKLQNVLLHDGDIVFARTGATTGKSYLLKSPNDAVFASYLIRLSVDKNKLLPKYVYHYFQSASYWEQINKGISGAAQGGFNASKLGELQVPIIDMREQSELTLKLDKVFYETLSLMKLYQKKIELLMPLKSAIFLKELNNKAA